MSFLDELKTYNIDVDTGLDRMMGNTALYQKMLVSLKKMIDDCFQTEYTDISSAIDGIHKVKGAAGNLSVTPLFEAYSEMLKYLRANDPEQARAIYNNILPVQNEILSCIEKYMEV